jgi:phosphatidylglycerophosphate synthase
MLAAAFLAVWQTRPEVLAWVAIWALAIRTAKEGRTAVGLANTLTWLRVLATAGLVLLPHAGLMLVAAAFTVFALDGVDGAIARARGTESEFGADLDKECDAFFVLMVGLLLWHQGTAGLWILIPGAWRYVYSLIVSMVHELRPAPRSNWGRYSYSTSCVCLILALWQHTPAAVALCALATALISASFLRSLYYCLPRS